MAYDTSHPAWWGFHGAGGARGDAGGHGGAGGSGHDDGHGGAGMSVLALIADDTLDADLAALLWLLLEARTPLIVAAGPPLAGKTTVLTALLEFLPPGTVRVYLRGVAEEFEWLPEATALGWRPDAESSAAAAWVRRSGIFAGSDGEGTGAIDADAGVLQDGVAVARPRLVSPGSTYLLAAELSGHLPVYTWGTGARVAVRALGLGYGLGTTIHGDSLEDVFSSLRTPDVGLTDDELSRLGVVLVLRFAPGPTGAPRRRIVAAHYVRPLMRDAGGHLQRLAPAVLAARDERTGTLEHFAWGVTPELAARARRRAGDFEAELATRADYLRGAVASGSLSVADARSAIAGYRPAVGGWRPGGV